MTVQETERRTNRAEDSSPLNSASMKTYVWREGEKDGGTGRGYDVASPHWQGAAEFTASSEEAVHMQTTDHTHKRCHDNHTHGHSNVE